MNQVFCQQHEEFCAAVAFQVLEFGQRAVDLAGRAQAGSAVGFCVGMVIRP